MAIPSLSSAKLSGPSRKDSVRGGNITTTRYDDPNLVNTSLRLRYDAGTAKSYFGTTGWYDLSGNGNNATIVNGSTFDGASLYFNSASNQYATVPHSSTYKPSFPLSLEAWVKTPTVAATPIFASDYSASNYAGYRFDSSTVRFGDGSGAASTDRVTWSWTASSSVNNGGWHHVMLSATGLTTGSVYVDGVSVTVTRSGTGASLSYSSAAGYVSFGIVTPLAGESNTIGYIAVYAAALSGSDAAQNFNALRGRYGV